MRRDNSSFKTAFLSEAGSRLKNNDYFGFVELDGYACYVVADGITHMHGSTISRASAGGSCGVTCAGQTGSCSMRKVLRG